MEPVKYTLENVTPVKPGDVIPAGKLIIFRDLVDPVIADNRAPFAPDDPDRPITWAGYRVVAYAPAPILELPPEPKEVSFGEAMERMRDGEMLRWDKGTDTRIIGVHDGKLSVLSPGSASPVVGFTYLSQGTFYELPAESAKESTGEQFPDPAKGSMSKAKAAGLRWWQAIEAIRGTEKVAKRRGMISSAYAAKWDSGTLMNGDSKGSFLLGSSDLDAEWEIVE